MRKWISLFVAAMMLLAVPALANPSVSATVEVTTPNVTVAPANADTVTFGSSAAAIAAAAVVEAVGGQGVMTPAEAVQQLSADPAVAAQVEGYSFSSQFNSISGDAESLKSVSIPGTTADTKIMLIDPETGEVVILTPNEDGTFTFPFPGVFALMDPTPQN